MSAAHHDQAFAAFFLETHARMVRMAHLISRNHADAEDAVARAYVKVFPRWQAGALEHPQAYLRTAVTNEVLSGFRRQRRCRELLDGDDRGGAVPDVGERGAEDRLAARDEMAAALSRLPVRQRTVVVLRYYEQLSEREIAQVMGISTGTVKSTAARALARLREVLAAASADVATGEQPVLALAS